MRVYSAPMQWWNDLIGWFGSRDGQLVLFSAIIPFFAILVAGVVAAAIGRGSTKRLLTLNDRENRVAAVATMIGAARRASVWNTLSSPEQQHADHVASEADVRVRLLAVPGSGLAADWAAHELAAMKRNSVSFSFQAEQSLIEFRERMVQWQARPSRAKKLFKNDLDLWAYEDSQATKDIISQQQAWAASQVAAPAESPAAPTPATASPAASSAAASPAAASTSTDRPLSATRDAENGDGARSEASAPARPAAVSIADLAATGDGNARSDGEAPALVEPSARARDEDSLEDDEEARGGDAGYSPVTASAVTRRINPPSVGDDGRSY